MNARLALACWSGRATTRWLRSGAVSSLRRRWLPLLAVALAPLPAAAQTPAPASAASPLRGQVVEEATNRPLNNMQVQIVGTSRLQITNERGEFLFAGLPAGTYEVRATGLGYAQGTATVTVGAAAAATVRLALTPSALPVDALVVNAVTGQVERKRELGNSVGRISSEQIQEAATSTVSQVLQARTPSVTVSTSSGTVGSNQRLRVRGSNSISLNNDPLLIIDGVQANASSTGLDAIDPNAVYVGGAETSRWNDLNPAEIENIEIIKGPAAAALYGTAAASGVVIVTTRRGRSGDARWNAHVEYGGSALDADFPANFQQIGVSPAGSRVGSCNLDLRSRGQCTPVADSLLSYNPVVAQDPFRNGNRRSVGLGVMGGSERLTYFVSGETESEQGVLDPNKLSRQSFRANLDGRLSDNFSLRLNTGYVRSEVKLPWNDNSSYGTMGNALLAQASSATDSVRRGWYSRPPSDYFFIESGQEVNRFTGGINMSWQMAPWLNVVAQAGLDHTARHDFQLAPSGILDENLAIEEGWRFSNRFELRTISSNVAATATRSLSPHLVSTTTLGGAYTSDGQFGVWANGRQLLAGTGTLGGAAAGATIDETEQEIITIGAFARQQFSWKDRLFLNASLRGDDNSAFGADFEFVTYPAASVAWVVSEEPFFPALGALDQVRLRAAYGQSGQRPGFRQAKTYYNPVAVNTGVTEQTAVSIGGTGNAILSPERSREWEGGFDVGMFGGRAGVEMTYYDKLTNDALVARRLPPSLGGSNARFENIGSVSNRGLELELNTQLLQRKGFRWHLNLSASTNRNRVLDLGEGVEPIIFNSQNVQRHTEGYPLGAFFQRTISFQDLNGDGMLSRANCAGQPTLTLPDGSSPACEITLSDSVAYLGTPFPTRQLGLTTSITLFDRLSLWAQFDYKGGNKQYNYTNYFRCAGVQNCADVQVAGAPLDRQAAYYGGRFLGSMAGYIEDADFVKLRELSLTYDVPPALTRHLGANGLSLTLAGRNLATWTKYSGFDPEVNSLGYTGTAAAGGDFYQQDFLTLPPVRQWSLRANVTF